MKGITDFKLVMLYLAQFEEKFEFLMEGIRESRVNLGYRQLGWRRGGSKIYSWTSLDYISSKAHSEFKNPRFLRVLGKFPSSEPRSYVITKEIIPAKTTWRILQKRLYL